MTYRIIADENVEPHTRRYLDQLGHDIEWVGDVPELGLSVTDEDIAAYSLRTDRLVLTQDDDFFTILSVDETAGVLYQKDQRLSGKQVGDIVHEIATHVSQAEVTLEYVSTNWL